MEKLRSDIPNEYKWDLTKIIKDDTEYENYIAEINMLTDKIANMKGHIGDSQDNLYCYLECSTSLNEKIEKIYVYSNLYFYQDMQDKKGLELHNRADTINEDITIKLAWASTELMAIGYEKIREYINSDKRLEKYKYYLEKTFRYESHILTEKEENIIAQATKAFGTPDEAYGNIDNVDIDLGYIKDEKGEKVKLTPANFIKFMGSHNKNVRKNAFKNMYKFYQEHINTISALYTGCIKENYFLSNVRKFNNPLEMSLYSDNIKEDFYHHFIEEIHKYLPLLYKYFKVKNKMLGYKSHIYDVYVDLVSIDNKNISFEEAKKIVFDGLNPLGDRYLNDLNKAFTNHWIDIYPNKYKRSGAYEWGCFGVEPYVSLNYTGEMNDVETMAHELGHAMHTFYANQTQDFLYAGYPIFLAEIASTVNEVLLNDYLCRNAKNDDEKIVYLQEFLDRVRTTIFRQTMFAEFEAIMHKKYQDGETLSAENYCNTYYELNKKYFGTSVILDEDIKYEWARIPHFYTSFYVYKYATGLISALSIASDILNGNKEATDNYINKFLSAGGSDDPLNILKNANVDITSSKTINKAFCLFESKLNELESLVEKKCNNE